LRQSHILPEFFYQPLYNQEHWFYRISDQFKKQGEARRQYEGLKEHLLCADCEELLNKRYETYAHSVLYGKEPLMVEDLPGAFLFSQIDYGRFKLFLLSVLWRMGISSYNAFEVVKLGSHEETLRTMIFEGNPGAPEDYGCIISVVMHDKEIVKEYITPAYQSFVEGHNCYKIFVGGFAFCFFVSDHIHKLSRQDFFLTRSGVQRIDIMPPDKIRFFIENIKDIKPLLENQGLI